MRRFTVIVLSMFCLFAGLTLSAGTAVAQSPNRQQKVTLTPETLFFGVTPGRSAIASAVLSNHSGAALNVSRIEIDGKCFSTPNCRAQFHVVSHGCGATLKNGGNCTINVEFLPPVTVETEVARANLKVTFNAASLDQSRKVALTGVSQP
jgi:hypothetical protein